jgi:hypothetical protein
MKHPLYLFQVKEFYRDIPRECSRCGHELYLGNLYRRTKSAGTPDRYCAMCVGFFLSRYGMTWDIQEPTEQELFWAAFFDEEILNKQFRSYTQVAL